MSWPQYSLRSIFIVVLFFGAWLSCWMWNRDAAIVFAIVGIGVLLLVIGRKMDRGGAVLCGAILLIVGLILAPQLETETIRDGHAYYPLTVVVTDSKSGRPIANATAWIQQGEGNFQPKSTIGTANANGQAIIRNDFWVTSRDSLFTHRAEIIVGYDDLHIEAPGYKTVDVPLRQFLGKGIDKDTPPIPPIKVLLSK